MMSSNPLMHFPLMKTRGTFVNEASLYLIHFYTTRAPAIF